jgi:hypothetical protein
MVHKDSSILTTATTSSQSGYNSDDGDYHPNHFQGHQGFGGQGGALGGIFGGAGGGMGGPGGLFGQFGGFGGHMNAPAPPSAFNRPYRAYSAAIHEIQHGRGNAGASVIDGGRAQVMFGGQSMYIMAIATASKTKLIDLPFTFSVIMPPDALRQLSRARFLPAILADPAQVLISLHAYSRPRHRRPMDI